MSLPDDQRISFADPAVQRCPFPHYETLRNERPVYQDPVTGNYVLTRYADIRAATLDVGRLSNRTGLTTREDPDANSIYQQRGWLPVDTLANNDPPSHRIYRTLVDKVFTTARVKAMEPGILLMCHDLIDSFQDLGGVDFLEAFAVKLPMFVIAQQLGIETGDMDRFKRWSNVSVELVSPTVSPEREIFIAETLVEMQNYLAREIEQVRAAPNDKLISLLSNVEVDGAKLSVQELLGVIHQILVAGNETTTTTFASAMKLMIEDPELSEQLYVTPDKIPAFIEEVLRLHAPIQALFRKATENVVIADVTIPRGAIVEVRFGSANRDERQFACPELLDLERHNAKAHMSFGYGIHLCIGNQLARSELRIGLTALTQRLCHFRASRGADSYHWIESFIAHGLDRLWLGFDKRSGQTGLQEDAER